MILTTSWKNKPCKGKNSENKESGKTNKESTLSRTYISRTVAKEKGKRSRNKNKRKSKLMFRKRLKEREMLGLWERPRETHIKAL